MVWDRLGALEQDLADMTVASIAPVMAIKAEQIWIALIGSLRDKGANQRRRSAVPTNRTRKSERDGRRTTRRAVVN